MSDELFDSEDIAREAQLSAQRLERASVLSDYRKVLELPEGRRLLWRLLSHTGPFQMTAADDPHWTYFREGRRSVGTKIFTEILEAAPASYMTMVAEANSKEGEKNV